MRIKFIKTKKLIKEIKEDQVLKRLDGKKFNKLLKHYNDNIEDLGDNGIERIKKNIKDNVTTDVPEKYKGEFLSWCLSVMTKMMMKAEKPPKSSSPDNFVNWIWGRGEEIPKLSVLGKNFYEFKEKKRDRFLSKNSIYGFESFSEFHKIIRNAKGKYRIWSLKNVEKEELENVDPNQHKIFENEDWTVYIPNTRGAACLLGKGTSWCTSGKTRNLYYRYHQKEGPLIIFISKRDPKEKYQFQYDKRQFMNRDNDPIDYYEEEEENFFGVVEKVYYFEYSTEFDELNNLVIKDLPVPGYIKNAADWIDTQREMDEWYDDDWKPDRPD